MSTLMRIHPCSSTCFAVFLQATLSVELLVFVSMCIPSNAEYSELTTAGPSDCHI